MHFQAKLGPQANYFEDINLGLFRYGSSAAMETDKGIKSENQDSRTGRIYLKTTILYYLRKMISKKNSKDDK